jgi:hypothetical protein
VAWDNTSSTLQWYDLETLIHDVRYAAILCDIQEELETLKTEIELNTARLDQERQKCGAIPLDDVDLGDADEGELEQRLHGQLLTLMRGTVQRLDREGGAGILAAVAGNLVDAATR